MVAYLLYFHRWQSVFTWVAPFLVSNFVCIWCIPYNHSLIPIRPMWVQSPCGLADMEMTSMIHGVANHSSGFCGHGGLTPPSDLRFRSQNLFVEYISVFNAATKCGFVRWKMHTQVSHTGCFKKSYEVKWLMTMSLKYNFVMKYITCCGEYFSFPIFLLFPERSKRL